VFAFIYSNLQKIKIISSYRIFNEFSRYLNINYFIHYSHLTKKNLSFLYNYNKPIFIKNYMNCISLFSTFNKQKICKFINKVYNKKHLFNKKKNLSKYFYLKKRHYLIYNLKKNKKLSFKYDCLCTLRKNKNNFYFTITRLSGSVLYMLSLGKLKIFSKKRKKSPDSFELLCQKIIAFLKQSRLLYIYCFSFYYMIKQSKKQKLKKKYSKLLFKSFYNSNININFFKLIILHQHSLPLRLKKKKRL
jgi:hypothetical protein